MWKLIWSYAVSTGVIHCAGIWAEQKPIRPLSREKKNLPAFSISMFLPGLHDLTNTNSPKLWQVNYKLQANEWLHALPSKLTNGGKLTNVSTIRYVSLSTSSLLSSAAEEKCSALKLDLLARPTAVTWHGSWDPQLLSTKHSTQWAGTLHGCKHHKATVCA